MKTYIQIAAALCVLIAGPAHANDPIAPEILYPQQERAISNRAIDIIGMVPGMDSDAIRAILEKSFEASEISTRNSSLSVSINQVRVRTVDFLSSLQARKRGEGVDALFVGPSGQSQAYQIMRGVQYSDNLSAPTMATMEAALIEKYGQPSRRSTPYSGTVRLVWGYKDDQQVDCILPNGREVSGCYAYGSNISQSALASQREIFDLVIDAEINAFNGDRDKVRTYQVTVVDVEIKGLVDAADYAALEAEAVRIYNEAQSSTATPVL